jgi:hypothetical protein
MGDSSPDSPDSPDKTDQRSTIPSVTRRPGSSSPETPAPGPSLSRASVPPSEPRSTSRGSFSQIDIGAADRPARLQMIVALILGLVLVAIPLYLWRRPRADAVAVASAGDAGAELAAAPPATPATDEKPTTSDVKNLLCQDPGPKKTAPEQCDHVVDVEKAFAKAIEESASCMPKDVGGGTIIYVADVSFKRKAVNVATPTQGRTMKNVKAISACQAAVKSRLQALPLDPITHAHARYKISMTATYAGPVK